MYGRLGRRVSMGLVSDDVSILLPAVVESARAAREAVDALALGEHDEAGFAVRLLVTELVSNSVRHAGLSSADSIAVEVWVEDGLVRGEVTDRGPGFDRPAFDQPPAGVSGRGLYLVDALADQWGVERTIDDQGWVVWFQIELDQ
jgi:anti-sigma regulatory factor (Ser/Thr protein kinase)